MCLVRATNLRLFNLGNLTLLKIGFLKFRSKLEFMKNINAKYLWPLFSVGYKTEIIHLPYC